MKPCLPASSVTDVLTPSGGTATVATLHKYMINSIDCPRRDLSYHDPNYNIVMLHNSHLQ